MCLFVTTLPSIHHATIFIQRSDKRHKVNNHFSISGVLYHNFTGRITVLRKMSELKKRESFTHFAQVLAEGQGIVDDEEVWYVTNASDHMTPKREWFTTFEEVPAGEWSVGELDGSHHWVRGRGNIKIHRKLGLQWEDGVLENVLYAPELRKSLFSLGRAVKQGNSASFGGDECTLRNSEGVEILTGTGHGGLFKLHVRVMPPELSC